MGIRPMMHVIRRLNHDESGATAIEYGFITLLIGMAIVGALTSLGPAVSNVFTTVNADLAVP